jgi:hypothetical protein
MNLLRFPLDSILMCYVTHGVGTGAREGRYARLCCRSQHPRRVVRVLWDIEGGVDMVCTVR